MSTDDVWLVQCVEPDGDVSFVLVAATLDAAQRSTAEYVGEESLTWEHRNSIFDSQDYLVAEHDEYHVHAVEVES